MNTLNRLLAPRFILSLVALLALSCTCPLSNVATPAPDLHTRLDNHIANANQSSAKAHDLWHRVEDSTTPVSCTETIPVPPLFDLTEAEAQSNPASVAVRDHLNNGITFLSQFVLLWEAECAKPEPTIAISTLRQGEELLQQADTELLTAATASQAWQ